MYTHLPDKQTLENLQAAFIQTLDAAQTPEAITQIRNDFLGRKDGKLTKILRQLKTLPEAERKAIGMQANAMKKTFEDALQEKLDQLGKKTVQKVLIDVTAPGKKPNIGRLHPISSMIQHIRRIFEQLNFDITNGPEIEDDYYNFSALNFQKEHPARDMHETFFLPRKHVLRTHTTATDIHYLETRKPPIRMVTIGKTYRRDADLTHTPMFHQFDGLMIDEHISMAHLKGLLHIVMERLLEARLEVRFRISYFPFVEPGAEFDVTCTLCRGEGCVTCKGTGWLEMGGCGMLHPNVLKNAKIDSEKYQALAFGFGIERPLMIKHKVSDLRIFFENDIRFLKQFDL